MRYSLLPIIFIHAASGGPLELSAGFANSVLAIWRGISGKNPAETTSSVITSKASLRDTIRASCKTYYPLGTWPQWLFVRTVFNDLDEVTLSHLANHLRSLDVKSLGHVEILGKKSAEAGELEKTCDFLYKTWVSWYKTWSWILSKTGGVGPDWVVSEEVGQQTVAGTTYNLQHLTTTPSGSTIWYATNSEDRKVMKVSHNCGLFLLIARCRKHPASCESDPIMDEFRIMNTLGSLPNAVVPNAQTVSVSRKFTEGPPPEPLAVKVVGLLKDNESVEQWKSCSKKDKWAASYRAILEDMVGPELYAVARAQVRKFRNLEDFGRRYLQELVMMTRRTIGLLWRFHDLGFIHGDVHSKNVAFKFKRDAVDPATGRAVASEYSALTDEMVLIDFGLSRFFPDDIDKPEDETATKFNSNKLPLSHWQMQGKRMGRRDDLARAMSVLDSYITDFFGKPVAATLSKKEAVKTPPQPSSEELQKYKSSYLFSTKEALGEMKEIQGFEDALRNLDIALDLIRGIGHVDEKPNYEGVIGALDRAILYSSCSESLPATTDKLRVTLADLWKVDTEDFVLDGTKISRFIRDPKDYTQDENDSRVDQFLGSRRCTALPGKDSKLVKTVPSREVFCGR
jgi:hypothetical protein